MALVWRERLQGQGGAIASAPSPTGPFLQQVWPCWAHQQQRSIAHSLCQVFQQVKQRLIRPVNIINKDQEWLPACQRLKKDAPGAEKGLALLFGITSSWGR